MRSRVLVIGGLGLLAVLGAVWFLSTYERVPYKEQVGPSSEVRLRQFLAAERFAERMGVPASEIRSLPELEALEPGGVLLMPARRQALEPRRLRDIAAWVERGGHLVAEAEFLGVSDPLFDLLGVRRDQVDATGKPLIVEVDGRKLTVSLASRMTLQAPAGARVELRAGPAEAARLISYHRGKGMVTAVTSLQFVRNYQIGANDHAELFWELLSLTPAPALQVYHRPERLSLTGFLRERAPEAAGACLALLALWLWRIAPRFGPVAPDAPPARRRLLDHLRASGRYYWAKGLRGELVLAARDAALRRLARAQPDFAVASQPEKVSRLASLTGISQEEARRFLAAGGPMRGADFIKLARDAQSVHTALEKGKK
ncbi:MAG TPA: DUF4350 domain-containing protein [Burkholderiales bacterium]|nr:DUF4350 domain-containing protein [Burkholderiales bacterium]